MLPVAALLPDWLPGEPLCPRDTLGSPQAFDAMHVLRVDDLLSQGVRSGPWFRAHDRPRADSRTRRWADREGPATLETTSGWHIRCFARLAARINREAVKGLSHAKAE